MPKKPPKGRIDSAPDATRVGKKGAKVGKAPAYLVPAPTPAQEVRAFLDERRQIEAAMSRVGTPAQQRAARDSTVRGFRNLLKKK